MSPLFAILDASDSFESRAEPFVRILLEREEREAELLKETVFLDMPELSGELDAARRKVIYSHYVKLLSNRFFQFLSMLYTLTKTAKLLTAARAVGTKPRSGCN
jgi:hypothetical protein